MDLDLDGTTVGISLLLYLVMMMLFIFLPSMVGSAKWDGWILITLGIVLLPASYIIVQYQNR